MFQNNNSNNNSSNNPNPFHIANILQNLPNEQLQRCLRYIEAQRKRTDPFPNPSAPPVFTRSYGFGTSSLNPNISSVNTSQNTSFLPSGLPTGNENMPPPGNSAPSLNGLNPANVVFDILDGNIPDNKPNIHAGSEPPSGDAFNVASSERPRPRFYQSDLHNHPVGLPFPLPSNAVVPPHDVLPTQYNHDTWERMNGNACLNPYMLDPPLGHNNVFLPPIQNHPSELATSLPGPQDLLNLAPPQPPPPPSNHHAFLPDFSAPPTLEQQWQMFMPIQPNEATRHQILLPPPITYFGNNDAECWADGMSPASGAQSLNSVSSNLSYLYSAPSSSNSATTGQSLYYAPESVFIAPQDGTDNPGPLTKLDNYDGTPSRPTSTQTSLACIPNAPTVDDHQSSSTGGSSSAQQDRRSNASSRSQRSGPSKRKRRKQQPLPIPELWTCLGPTQWRCRYKGPAQPEGCTSVATTSRNLARHMRTHSRREVEMGLPEESRVAYNGLPDELRWMTASCPLDDAGLPGCRYYRQNGYRWKMPTLLRPEYLVKQHVASDHNNR